MTALTVADVMTRYVEFLAVDATAQDAAVMMGELDVGALPIGSVDELVGVVTDRDILYRVTASGLPPTTPVADILSRPAVVCREHDAVRTAMDLMASHHIRRLAVIDAQGAVSGWITLADLSRKLLVESDALQGTLRGFSEG